MHVVVPPTKAQTPKTHHIMLVSTMMLSTTKRLDAYQLCSSSDFVEIL